MRSVETFESDISNNWLVYCFEAYRFNDSSFEDKFFPRPVTSIIFHFKEQPIILDENPIALKPFFVAPVISQAIPLRFQGDIDTFAIHCKSTVISRILGLDMSLTEERCITLPHNLFLPLWEKMSTQNTTAERIECFSDFINTIQPSPYIPDAIDDYCDKIIKNSIFTPLKTIMQECYESKSSLHRKFTKRAGATPKTLARIVRLDYLWRKIINEKVIDYQRLIFEGNYFDQAHFINDFKSIIGETPGYFFNRNLKTVKLFSGDTSENQ